MKKTISYVEYLDKVYSAWAGKCAGGIIGAAQENNKNVLHYTFDNVFPDKIPPNDDFDLQILFLQEVLEKKGFNFDHNDLAEAFARYNICWANEYRYAIKNINCGVMPPMSGVYCNDFFLNSLGCPIRSELWGLLAIGNPELAIKFVEMDGCIDHDRESIESEKFNAVMECLAFFETDLISLINKSKNYISKDSRAYECIEFMIEQADKYEDWLIARNNLIAEFGSCDASDAIVNLGITLLALFYGRNNFNDTMLIAVNCGYDTDCTSATAGSVLGIMLGKSKMDPAWLEKIGEEFVVGTVNIVRERNTLTQLTEDTFELAYALCRDNLNDIFFVDVPEAYECRVQKYRAEVLLKTIYNGEPSVSVVKDCEFEVQITNPSNNLVCGKLSYTTTAPILVSFSQKEVEIQPNSTVTVIGIAKVCGNDEYIPVGNVGELCFDCGNYKKTVKLGFYSESKYNIYGPYFDNYDTKKYDYNIYGEKRQGERMEDLFPMFNGYVNIDREYVENEGNLTSEPYKIMYTAKDKLPIGEYVKYKGPCCVYLEREVYSDEEQIVHAFNGFTSPYKMYLNGEIVAEYKGENVCWMPLNGFAEITLKKGKNIIVYKLTRTSGEFEFSSVLTRRQSEENIALINYKNHR